MKCGLERNLAFVAISLTIVTILAYLNYCKLDKLMNIEKDIKQSRRAADAKISEIESLVDKVIDKDLEMTRHKEILADVVYSFDHVSSVSICFNAHCSIVRTYEQCTLYET